MGISSALGSSALLPAGLGFRNLVINGAMTIDQRNAGAAVTGQTTNFFCVDRFICSPNSFGIFTAQQTTNSSLSGSQLNEFKNSLGLTVTTARTPASGDVYGIRHRVEGNNCYQLAWGTSSAKQVVLSFWVRSSVTGTYSVAFFNAAGNRSYVATYTINSANTWEYKTVMVMGDVTGTWAKDNTTGIEIFWDLGTGSTYETSAGSWQTGIYVRTSASAKWISNAGATFYITGVQLEQNYQPTPFEQRPIGVELQLCQRYYYRMNSGNAYTRFALGTAHTADNAYPTFQLPVQMRATPTGLDTSAMSTFLMYNSSGANFNTPTSIGANSADQSPVTLTLVVTKIGAYTATYAYQLIGNNTTSAYIGVSAEL